MPLTDWQFWVVTLLCLLAAFRVYRVVRPRRSGQRGHRVKLTVERTSARNDQPTESSESTAQSRRS